VHSADPRAAAAAEPLLGAFYRACVAVFSPSRAADSALAELGVAPRRILRSSPAVDTAHFHPARYAREAIPEPTGPDGVFNVLHAGRLSAETGAELLADAFLTAREREPRLRLVLAGDGPDRRYLEHRLGSAATVLGWLDRDALAHAYASADLLLCPRQTDGGGQMILEAQASGLPVLAVDRGGGAELIEPGRSGCLAAPEAQVIASAIFGLARRGALRERLATGGLLSVRARTWERSLHELAGGWRTAVGAGAAAEPELATVARAA
jgi:glycosyltransferase involved in cell wall biosynthesis